MEKNLLVGDFLLVSKMHYGTRMPITVGVPFTDIYDIPAGSWRVGSPPPRARGGYASAVLEGRVLVISGELGIGAGGIWVHESGLGP